MDRHPFLLRSREMEKIFFFSCSRACVCSVMFVQVVDERHPQ